MNEVYSYDKEHELIKATRKYYELAQKAKSKGNEIEYNKNYTKYQNLQSKLNELRQAI